MNIRIISPAKAIERSKIDFAQKWLEEQGLTVSVGKNAYGEHNYFSGTDEERLADLQEAINDDSIDAIVCSRGGYGLVRIVDRIDFGGLGRKPKLICGYSDITVLHNHLHTNFDFATVHCTAPLNFQENTAEALNSMLNVLKGSKNEYSFDGNLLNRKGNVTAQVVGGNLSILASLIGTNSDLDTAGKILLIEDIGEAVYAVDRMMWSLKKSGKLSVLAGLIVGGMTNMKDSEIPFGKTVNEVIAEAVSEYDYPVCFDFPAGHIDDNRAIVLGYSAHLNVDDMVSFSQ